MSDAVVTELAGAGLALTARWVAQGQHQRPDTDAPLPHPLLRQSVVMAERDQMQTELSAPVCRPSQPSSGPSLTGEQIALAENARLHSEVTRLGVELRQAKEAIYRERRRGQEMAQPMTICVDQGNYLEWIGSVPYPLRERIEAALAKAPKRAPVLPTSANPEHVRRMSHVLRASCGSGQNWYTMARAALDVLPELVGK